MFINQLIVQQGKVALLLNNDERTVGDEFIDYEPDKIHLNKFMKYTMNEKCLYTFEKQSRQNNIFSMVKTFEA